jgi:hypothetical protein
MWLIIIEATIANDRHTRDLSRHSAY